MLSRGEVGLFAATMHMKNKQCIGLLTLDHEWSQFKYCVHWLSICILLLLFGDFGAYGDIFTGKSALRFGGSRYIVVSEII